MMMVNAILILTALEAAFLLWRRRTDLLLTLCAGFGLLAALRLTLANAAWPLLALALLAAGVAHLADLLRRWH